MPHLCHFALLYWDKSQPKIDGPCLRAIYSSCLIWHWEYQKNPQIVWCWGYFDCFSSKIFRHTLIGVLQVSGHEPRHVTTLGNSRVTMRLLVGLLVGILLVSTIYQLSEILTDLGVHVLSLRYLCEYLWVCIWISVVGRVTQVVW
jgi:hypothetical protein